MHHYNQTTITVPLAPAVVVDVLDSSDPLVTSLEAWQWYEDAKQTRPFRFAVSVTHYPRDSRHGRPRVRFGDVVSYNPPYLMWSEWSRGKLWPAVTLALVGDAIQLGSVESVSVRRWK